MNLRFISSPLAVIRIIILAFALTLTRVHAQYENRLRITCFNAASLNEDAPDFRTTLDDTATLLRGADVVAVQGIASEHTLRILADRIGDYCVCVHQPSAAHGLVAFLRSGRRGFVTAHSGRIPLFEHDLPAHALVTIDGPYRRYNIVNVSLSEDRATRCQQHALIQQWLEVCRIREPDSLYLISGDIGAPDDDAESPLIGRDIFEAMDAPDRLAGFDRSSRIILVGHARWESCQWARPPTVHDRRETSASHFMLSGCVTVD